MQKIFFHGKYYKMKEKMFSKPDAFSKNHSVTQEETVLLLIQLHHVSLVTKHLERRRKKEKGEERKRKKERKEGRERHCRQLFVTVKKYSKKSNVTISKLQKFRFFLLSLLSFSFLGDKRNQIKPTKISFSHLLSLFGVSLERERTKKKEKKDE